METYTYKLEPSEGLNVSGHVIIKCPTLPESMRFTSSCGFKVGEDGKVETKKDRLEVMADVIDAVGPFVKEVNVEFEGKKITSWEGFLACRALDAKVLELSNLFMGGFKPGKN